VNERERGRLVGDLSSCITHGDAAISDVPKILLRLLEEDAWRDFQPLVGERVVHPSWKSFVETLPTKGLGSDVATVDRLAGNEPDVLRLLKRAKHKGAGGRPSATCDESPQVRVQDNAEDVAERLARDAPEQLDAVRRGELSLNAAAVLAGIRPKRVPVRIDDAESAARTLRRSMPTDVLTQLARLLAEEVA
jgi:hypothetical protein